MSNVADHIGQEANAIRRTARPRLIMALMLAGAGMGALSLSPSHPRLVWNYTPSVPVGLYAVAEMDFARGDLVVIRLEGERRLLLERAGAIRHGHLLIKPVAAAGGDVVCRNAQTITVGGTPVAVARTTTRSGDPLPVWSGCRTLSRDDVFVLADHPASFDSRYFGPLPAKDVVGVARPVALLPLSQEAR